MVVNHDQTLFARNLPVIDSWLGLKSFGGNGRNDGMRSMKWTGKNLSILKLSLFVFLGACRFLFLVSACSRRGSGENCGRIQSTDKDLCRCSATTTATTYNLPFSIFSLYGFTIPTFPFSAASLPSFYFFFFFSFPSSLLFPRYSVFISGSSVLAYIDRLTSIEIWNPSWPLHERGVFEWCCFIGSYISASISRVQ